jgi:hypothetical protein
MRVFIVGAGSVSGGAAIKAAQKLGAEIITTTSRSVDIEGASHTIYGIDLEKPDAVEKILRDTVLRSKPIDYLIYIPARGAVGMDVKDAKAEMVPASLEYSVIPYLKLAKALNPKRTIALSGFMAMPTLTRIYGAMTFTKIAMEELAVRNPQKLQIIRIGMFLSQSVRGIAILAQRRFMREPEFHPDWRADWKASGKKFSQFFYDMNYECEERMYREHSNGVPFRPTVPGDIQIGFERALTGEPAPIINILGPWLWTETQMPQLPVEITSRVDLIPESVYALV